jgi:bifunctional DNA-binding transcriptional regulator/antitoxin component of YhaV-PrlF toxin-antitoxin module
MSGREGVSRLFSHRALEIVLILFLCQVLGHGNLEKMGHKIKIQRVERGTTKSFYVNFPAALAEAAGIEKGEEMEWLVDDRNTFVLRRLKPQKPVAKGENRLT